MNPQPRLAPLAPLYDSAVRVKNYVYDHGLIKPDKLQAPVISIGNLSTGGTGKSPFVIALAKLLTDVGLSVDVLSRGHGRTSNAVVRVDPSPHSAAAQYGDEPLLIARNAGVPVYVGRSRHAAGILAEQTSSTKAIHLLDDGFQHRQLARDLDIVLLRPSDFTARLLPAGHLREPLSSLRRAHVAVLREEDAHLATQLRRHLPWGLIWHIRRQIFIAADQGSTIAFCGIAHPEDFFAGLRENKIELASTISFSDHHPFTEADLAHLCAQAKQTRATRFLTTEKDLVRLPPASLTQLQTCAPVQAARLQVTLVEADAALNLIRSL